MDPLANPNFIYGAVIGSWILSAITFAVLGSRLAARRGAENDGCLLAICCVFLAGLGGGGGLLLAGGRFPLLAFTSIAGAFLVPALAVIGYALRRRD